MLSSGFVKKSNIPENTGNTKEFSEIETNEYLSYKAEGDQASRGRVQQGYTKIMTKYRIGEDMGITYEMRHENKYNNVINALLSGGAKGYKTIDLDLSHRFTFGTADSYTDRDGRTIDLTVGDGLSLFNTAHTLKGSPTTFRNRLANNPQLSRGALEAMEKLAVEETYSQLGEKKTISFDTLWITDNPNLINTAKEYLHSTSAPDAAHEGVVNVYSGKYKLVVLPRVATTANGAPDTSKNKYWGLASSANSSFYFGLWEAPHMIPPKAGGNGEDPETDDFEFRNRAGYGITIVGASWIKFSSGDGQA